MEKNIGFIGLGLMGSGFTKRLAARGHTVIGFDIDAAKRDAAAGWKVEPSSSPADIVARADIICICVTTTHAVEEVVFGDSGILSAGNLSNKVIIDFSTTEMESVYRVAEALSKAGAAFIDAPVSGGPGAAENGSLAIMAGGDDEALNRVQSVLGSLGKTTHMGPTGAGQATKLVNQALCLTNYCVVAEGLRLAEAYGVDASKIPAALEPGLANSAVLQSIFPRMVDEDFEPRGYARQILKDLEMVHEATRAKHVAMPMVAQAMTMYRLLVGQGKSELDGAAVVTLLPKPDDH